VWGEQTRENSDAGQLNSHSYCLTDQRDPAAAGASAVEGSRHGLKVYSRSEESSARALGLGTGVKALMIYCLWLRKDEPVGSQVWGGRWRVEDDRARNVYLPEDCAPCAICLPRTASWPRLWSMLRRRRKASVIATIKRHVPEPVRVIVRRVRSRAVFSYDRRRFLAYYAGSTSRKHAQGQLEAKMTFFAHSLEKGLSHSEIRYQFGINALRNLAAAMDEFSSRGFDKSSAAYVNGLSVLREYVVLHDAAGENAEHVRKIFSEAIIEEVLSCDSYLGGTLPVSKKDKSENRDKTFRDLFLGRWSIREYASTPVDLNSLAEAIQIATKAPSVCNRQSARVTVFTDHEMVKQILDVQGGFTGYLLPPVLLMITTETSAFLSVTERNQVYTDGGLFSMALLLGLEYVSLAACALNAMFTVRDERKMRHIAGVPESENIIMFIAVGNFREQVFVPKSFRFPGSEITRGPGGGVAG